LAYPEEVEEIRTRMRNAFAVIYLGLLSIIQGVALAALFGKADSMLSRHLFHLPQLILSLGIFLAIVAVWNQYQMGVMLYAWTAELFDAFIPFTIGIFEFGMISALEYGASAVLLADGLLLLVGIAAFEQQYYQLRRNTKAAPFLQQLNRGFRAADIWSCVVGAAIALGSAAAIGRWAPNPTGDLIGSFVLVALALSHLTREVYQWRIVLQRLDALAA